VRPFNQTPFKFAPFAGRIPFPGHSLTLIVKGTFDLSPGAAAVLADEQLFPTGDEFYPDDEEQLSGPRYESDFTWGKPRADILLVGKCHAPGGVPVESCNVTFRVGDHMKSLAIVGDRFWASSMNDTTVSPVTPFTEMDLRYENAYGGEGYEPNPVGKGFGKQEGDANQKVYPLPNIEDPQHLIETWHDRPQPAGFGPLSKKWLTRRDKMGTYKDDYKETRWPWFPEDLDWSHFNAAPEAMQLQGYLRGDEQLYFENLHPEHPRYESRLPGVRVRGFLNRLTRPGGEETEFVEVEMDLDTLWVDMEAQQLVLVWRGWAQVLSNEYEEVQDIFVMSEPLDQPAATVPQCYELFLALQNPEEAVEPEEPPAEEPPEPPPADKKPPVDPAFIKAQAGILLAQMGIDVDSMPPEAKAKHDQLMEKLTETDPDKLADMQQQELDAQMREQLGKMDIDPDNLPPVSPKAKAEQVRLMKELGMKDADLGASSPELDKMWAMMAAVLPSAGIDPENMDPVIEQAKKQKEKLKKQSGIEEEEEEISGEADQGPIALTRETVQERVAKGESFEGEDLHGLDLSELDMKGIDFSGADLSEANLQNAVLAEANLTGAKMMQADLSGADMTLANAAGVDLSAAKLQKACLKEADLTGAKLVEADLTEAVIDDAVFEKASMNSAVLTGVSAVGTYFPQADLTGASFKNSVCPKADLSKSTLDQADFEGAILKEASVEGASGRNANLTEADLTLLRAAGGSDFTGAVFWRAQGDGSIWEKANLTECDFRYARMKGATFTGANLKQANLSAANMKSGRFNKANLREARLLQMNLFQGTLEKADLSGADLSGSNMYGVEFLDAVTDQTIVEGTNLKRTKMEEQ
jgi:uncharacterized protein YjbI with pentapeptide repeats